MLLKQLINNSFCVCVLVCVCLSFYLYIYVYIWERINSIRNGKEDLNVGILRNKNSEEYTCMSIFFMVLHENTPITVNIMTQSNFVS